MQWQRICFFVFVLKFVCSHLQLDWLSQCYIWCAFSIQGILKNDAQYNLTEISTRYLLIQTLYKKYLFEYHNLHSISCMQTLWNNLFFSNLQYNYNLLIAEQSYDPLFLWLFHAIPEESTETGERLFYIIIKEILLLLIYQLKVMPKIQYNLPLIVRCRFHRKSARYLF